MSTSINRDRLAADLLGVGAGDHVALRRVYDPASPKLYEICLYILRDRSEAEDALQETLLNVWRSAKTYDPDRALAPSRGWRRWPATAPSTVYEAAG